MAKNTKARENTGGKAKKKPYRAPSLTKYGEVRKLTQAKAGTHSDGTGKPSTKTSGSTA